jgi:aldehyde dehydrogenase (NAD+)/betaine-aldehyde dehydrogenase
MTLTDVTFALSSDAQRLIDEPGCFIDGHWDPGEAEATTKLNPTTGEALGVFRAASPAQVDRAVAAAHRAHEQGVWRTVTPAERSAVLFRLAALMEEHGELLKEIVVADVGTPVSLAQSLQREGALFTIRWFAAAAGRGPDGWYEQGMSIDEPVGGTHPGLASTGILVREPIGVVAAITAYNFPFTLAIWKLGGALAAGCTVVLQPSPRATLSTVALWRLIEQLELPAGTVNLVLGDADVGRRLTTHPLVDMVTFTGSDRVGGEVAAQAGRQIKKVVLELGGKSANILLPGTDVGAAVAPSLLRLVTNAGQRCGATSRIFVHEHDYDAFIEAAQAYWPQLITGDPRDPATIVGPLIDERHLEFVRGHIDRAIGGGATVLAGGGDPPAEFPGGFFLNPVLLGDVDNDGEFCQEEQFGPVGAVLRYADVEEAVALANASRYGLNANVFGPTPEAIRVARRIRAGNVTVNGGGRIRPDAPWGGYGHSGVGREAGNEGFREFFEIKHIQWPIR